DVLVDYAARVPKDALTHYQNRQWKPLTKAKLTGDANALRKWKPGLVVQRVFLRGGDGDPTDYSFEASLWIPQGGDGLKSTLRITLPVTTPANDAAALFARYAGMLPFESGSCGYTVQERDGCGIYEGVSWSSDSIYARCLGFQKYSRQIYGPHAYVRVA